MTAALRTLTRCLVCGFSEIRTDEVIDRGIVLLHECPRCDHRWTNHAPLGAVQRRSQLRTSRSAADRSAA